MYWFASELTRIVSAIAALKRACSIRPPMSANAAATASRSAVSVAVSSPGCGTSPKLRCALTSVRLTRLPQLASSSSLLRRTNSSHVKSVSCVSGPAAVR